MDANQVLDHNSKRLDHIEDMLHASEESLRTLEDSLRALEQSVLSSDKQLANAACESTDDELFVFCYGINCYSYFSHRTYVVGIILFELDSFLEFRSLMIRDY